MQFIMIIGAVLNTIGGIRILLNAYHSIALTSGNSGQTLQLKFFTAGTAVTFGSLYLYLYFYPQFAIPFLIFGAALKSWAFLSSAYLYIRKTIRRSAFFNFGVSNGVVALLFWYYIAVNAG